MGLFGDLREGTARWVRIAISCYQFLRRLAGLKLIMFFIIRLLSAAHILRLALTLKAKLPIRRSWTNTMKLFIRGLIGAIVLLNIYFSFADDDEPDIKP